MDRNDLARVNQLYSELSSLDAAERGFDNGGTIISMEISNGPPPIPPSPVGVPVFGTRVSTVSIEYPPQMVDGIKAQFADRRNEIAHELESLGVTGMDARMARAQAAPAPAAAPHPRAHR